MKYQFWWIHSVLMLSICGMASSAGELQFRMQEIDTTLGVGYAVRLLDMNSDQKPDILVVDKTRVIWHENPSWQQHTILEGKTLPDNVCIAPYDIDSDGQIDFALGAEWRFTTPTAGTLQWLRPGSSPEDPWSVFPIGAEPFIHRIRWADLDGDGRKELLVVPLFGAGTNIEERKSTPIRILAYKIPKDPARDRWYPEVIDDQLHVAHNFWPTDMDGDRRIDILVASYEGVSLLDRDETGKWRRSLLGTGNQDFQSPRNRGNRGASEIKRGKLAGGVDYIATIEPWHGFQVVVYLPPPLGGKSAAGTESLWQRQVLDDELKWGHAVWCADLDGDSDEELIIGVRDDRNEKVRSGLRIYDPRDEGTEWRRELIDPGGVAIEDLAAADLDADGRIDIVAVGRKTHNIRIYWNETNSSKVNSR